MKKTFTHIQKKLLEEKKEIEERLKALTAPTEEEETEQQSAWKERGQKSDENAAEVAEYADSLSVTDSLNTRLVSITQALDAIKKNTYGKCEACGNPIEEPRLAAMPTATLCMSCVKKK